MAGQLIFYIPPVDEAHQHLQAVANFTIILQVALVPIFFLQKSYKRQIVIRESKTLLRKKLLIKH